MFRRLVGQHNNGDKAQFIKRANTLFNLQPLELQLLLEIAWENRVHNPQAGSLGSPMQRSLFKQLPPYIITALTANAPNNYLVANRQALNNLFQWDHLIYAYMVENTKVFEIFRKVLQNFLGGEALGVPTAQAQNWLRNTEELFYCDPLNFTISNVRSHVRPDLQATRRNAYFRMFGMDLNHGKENNQVYPFMKPDASNRDFVTTFEDFLQEIWVGISNAGNVAGINRTDNAAIASYARQLHDMLNDRRLNGNLSREEFFFVSVMSWFHVTLSYDSPILVALRSEGNREDQRLYRVAEKVGVSAHAKTYDFFQLAEPMSLILTQIELGTFNDAVNVQAIFNGTNALQDTLRTIISHWSIATGRDMKVRRGLNVTIPQNSYRGYTSDNVPKAKSNGHVVPQNS